MPSRTRPLRWLFTIITITMLMPVAFASHRDHVAARPRQHLDSERLKAQAEQQPPQQAIPPQAVYAAPEPQDPALRQLRENRGKAYALFEGMREDVVALTRVTREPLSMPEFPIDQSDLIVVGAVTDAKGYVTENKLSAYSEYTINITKVFKGAANLVNTQVIAERFGATVVLPNGRTVIIRDANRGTPEVGHRYVVFLQYSPEGQDYFLLTAYDLGKGRVMAVDHWPTHKFLDGNRESTFLDLVQLNIKRSQQTNMERQQVVIERLKHTEEAMPTVNYAAAESQMATQNEIRKAIARFYNQGNKPFAKLSPESGAVSVIEDSFIPPKVMPVEESSVVVIGTITDAKGYLSEDKSGAYSEYSINVAEALKGAAKITGGQVIANRMGAKVILPAGRTILFSNLYEGTPEIGHHYVMFLKQSPGADSYSIITAYELIAGRVKALDRPEIYELYEGSQEATFLDILRTSLK